MIRYCVYPTVFIKGALYNREEKKESISVSFTGLYALILFFLRNAIAAGVAVMSNSKAMYDANSGMTSY